MTDKVITDKYVLFWGSEFSNFYPSEFEVDGKHFFNNEQYFMYRKAKFFKDEESAQSILKYGSDPKQAKKIGRKVKGFDTVAWSKVRFNIMLTGLKHKFQDPTLKQLLLSHGTKTFVEASPYDKIWGIGLSKEDPRAQDSSQWLGQNLLGKALTQLRNEWVGNR